MSLETTDGPGPGIRPRSASWNDRPKRGGAMRNLALCLGLLVTSGLAAQESGDGGEVYFPQQLTASELLNACASSSLSNRGRERKRFCAALRP